MIKTYRDLIVWQKSMRMVTETYRTTHLFPREEAYGLTNQLQRCAVSIPSNIAEGYARKSTKDYKRFLKISMGSLYELQTQIEIAFNLKYIDKANFNEIYNASREVEIMLRKLIESVK